MNINHALANEAAVNCFEMQMTDGPHLHVALDGNTLSVRLDGGLTLQLLLGESKGVIRSAMLTALNASDATALRQSVLGALNVLFGAEAALTTLQLDVSDYKQCLPLLLQSGLAVTDFAGDTLLKRECFLQQPDLWIEGRSSAGYPLAYLISNGKRHPRRPPQPEAAVVYRRFIPWLDQWLSLRRINPDTDLEHVHRWMNNPRVAAFWEEDGDLDKHSAFIATALADPHIHPLIGSLDDKPFGYFEVYWAKEDRIAPFYAATDYDRGLHMLVGEEWARGPHYIAAWLSSLVHYVMLDDPRTQAVVCEPRADNARMIDYLKQYGFAYLREFDFPHKRAALMVIEREVFAQRDWLTGLHRRSSDTVEVRR
ncbi:GNAT family N-acetyltransferase [Glaciimonas sp. GG7]